MRDGTYQVTTKHFVAGFVIEDGKLKDVAPVLARNILFWMKTAKKVPECPTIDSPTKTVNTPSV